MLAIETGLAAMVSENVVRINPYFPNAAERINGLEPLVVIIEHNESNYNLELENLSKSIPLIVLDEGQRSIRVLTRDHATHAEISELTSVIEKINQQQVIHYKKDLAQPVEQ
jgi:hypothetical protein